MLMKRLFSLCLACACLAAAPLSARAENADSKRLLDGSFEEACSFSGSYTQYKPGADDPWQTSAYTQLIELFTVNTGTYINSVKLSPTDGKQAAELNADEESTLYQIVKTEPSSLYEWGLDHGARTDEDTMALIIGPNQPYAPSKNQAKGYTPGSKESYRHGRDQFMQMVDWLKARSDVTLAPNAASIVVFSKQFGPEGSFLDNQDNQPFSLTPSSVYTQEWHIWIMTDRKASAGEAENPWGHYGLNAENAQDAEDTDIPGNDMTPVDLTRHYLYTVPAGQTRTLFAFTSVSNKPLDNGKTNPTYGNFLDNVVFRLYHVLSGSTTPHGSAVVGESDGGTTGTGEESGIPITSGKNVITYVPDGQSLLIEAKILSADTDDVTFAGVYISQTTEDGTVSTSFLRCTGDEDTNWSVTDDAAGNKLYTHTLANVKRAVDLHFIFIRSPIITYDANGGKPYVCVDSSNEYDFKPLMPETGIVFIAPYTSHEAQAPDGMQDDWRFLGFKVYNDYGEATYPQDHPVVLPGVHTIACNYKVGSADNPQVTQRFLAVGPDGSFTEDTGNPNPTTSVIWTPSGDLRYEGDASGLTLVAQWRWRQRVIPQIPTDSGYVDSEAGGTVSFTTGNPVYASDGQNGEKIYFAETNELLAAKAEPKDGYRFDGWVDEQGKLVSTQPEYSYTEEKEGVRVSYARFSPVFTQTYVPIIASGSGSYTGLENPGSYLDRTQFVDAAGVTASSTAGNTAQYAFVKWLDVNGGDVPDTMLANGGRTITYPIAGNATYYALYTNAVTVSFHKQFFDTDNVLRDVPDDNSTYGWLSAYSVQAAAGETVGATAYVQPGYKLTGWYNGSSSAAGKLTDAGVLSVSAPDADSADYYARYTVRTDTRYTVNHVFRGAGDKGKDLIKQEILKGTTGHRVTAVPLTPQSTDMVEGYLYNGDAIAEQSIKSDGSTVFTLYYVKTPDALTYAPNAPANAYEGSTAQSDGFTGWPVTVRAGGFTRAGHTFTGWNTLKDGSGTAYAPKSSYTLTAGEDILYAQWSANPDVLTYRANGGEGSDRTQTGVVNEALTVLENPFMRDGHTFSGWNTEPDGSGTAYAPKSGYTLTAGEDILYAQWSPIGATLTYTANGGAGEDVIQHGYETQPVTVQGNTFTREGYTFTGWNTRPDGSGDPYAPGMSYTLRHEYDILYAQWSANPDALIYRANSGEGSDRTQTGVVDEALTVLENPFTRDGHTFSGWNTEPDGSGTAYAPKSAFTLTAGEDILYAQWSVNPVLIDGLPETGDSSRLPLWGLMLAALTAVALLRHSRKAG